MSQHMFRWLSNVLKSSEAGLVWVHLLHLMTYPPVQYPFQRTNPTYPQNRTIPLLQQDHSNPHLELLAAQCSAHNLHHPPSGGTGMASTGSTIAGTFSLTLLAEFSGAFRYKVSHVFNTACFYKVLHLIRQPNETSTSASCSTWIPKHNTGRHSFNTKKSFLPDMLPWRLIDSLAFLSPPPVLKHQILSRFDNVIIPTFRHNYPFWTLSFSPRVKNETHVNRCKCSWYFDSIGKRHRDRCHDCGDCSTEHMWYKRWRHTLENFPTLFLRLQLQWLLLLLLGTFVQVVLGM